MSNKKQTAGDLVVKRLHWLKRRRHVLIMWLALASVLIVPTSSPTHNFRYQQVVICAAGFLAWLCIFIFDRDLLARLKNLAIIAVMASSVAVLILAHSPLNIWGNYFYPIGAVIVIAYVAIGLIASRLQRITILQSLFIISILVALASFACGLFPTGAFYLGRLTGIFFQPDLLAIFLAAGFLAGLALFGDDINGRGSRLLFISACETLLLSAIYLTQTRSILALVVALTIVFVLLRYSHLRVIMQGLMLPLLVLILLFTFTSPRLLSASYLASSSSYRLSLTKAVGSEFIKSPLAVKGNTGLGSYLSCQNLERYADLRQTCDEGWTFASSSNVFIDRFIEFGIIGGLGYVWLIISAVLGYFSRRKPPEYLAALILLLISGYYFTNVTAPTVELILWLLIIPPLLLGSGGGRAGGLLK